MIRTLPVLECAPASNDELMPASEAEQLAAMLKVLADPVRLRLLRLVADSPDTTACACHLPGALGISQPTMARVERGDPAVTMATYISCLWQLNPALDLTQLLASSAPPKLAPASDLIAKSANISGTRAAKDSKPDAELPADQQAQIERNFAAAKAALDFFKSPLF